MAFDKDTFGEVREKWRKHVLMTLANEQNWFHEVQGVGIPNTPENRSLFELLPEAHRRHDMEYTIVDDGPIKGRRKLSSSVMMVTPAAASLIDEIGADILASIRQAAEAAKARYEDSMPSTMESVKMTADRLAGFFGDDAKEAIDKANALMKEIAETEAKLAAEGKDYDTVNGGKIGDEDD